MLASLPPDAPFFLAVSGFQGVRPGYIFHRGAQGLGYYLDERQVGNDFVSARETAFITDARPGARSRAEGGDRERHEEVDIDLEGDVPDEVFGNLAAEAKKMRRNKE
uniref:XPA binding protein 2 family protein n=1 Tax=Toxoplasma gondii COUG TaxID=1074873 RepID=A0A2G8XPU4_TOXGO|nr:XPA binding protein 2 family protein [Toxoplasma gondii COUG]